MLAMAAGLAIGLAAGSGGCGGAPLTGWAAIAVFGFLGTAAAITLGFVGWLVWDGLRGWR